MYDVADSELMSSDGAEQVAFPPLAQACVRIPLLMCPS